MATGGDESWPRDRSQRPEETPGAWPGPSPEDARWVPPEAWTGGVIPETTSPRKPLHSARHIALAAALFALTCASTWFSHGTAYAAAIMLILTCHEMGHYVACRRYGVRSTLPLFIPMPVSPFGTMGAVILMSQIRRERRTLFDIGIAGPLAGLVPSIAAVWWGLAHSSVTPKVLINFPGLRLGDSLFFLGMQKLMFPGLPRYQEVLLHPVAYAGWAGCFVTALNLLPVGQLDGGHVTFGLLGRRSVWVGRIALAGLTGLAVWNPQWWVLVALLALLLRVRHRIAIDEGRPLGRWRVALGIFVMAVLILFFTPRPFIGP